jgi:hypothetical protein
MRNWLAFSARGAGSAAVATALVTTALVTVCVAPSRGAVAQPRLATQAAATAPVATGLYANISGLVMDAGGARRSGVTVVLHPDRSANGRRWLRETDGTIRPSYDTGLCLSVPGGHYRAGAKLDVETCKKLTSQHFDYSRSSGSTPVFFISPAGDRHLCASSATGSFTSGAAVTLASCGSLLTAPQTEVWGTAKPASNIGVIDLNYSLTGTGTTAGSAVVAWNGVGVPLGTLWVVGTEQVAPFGTERVLRPLSNTALCVTVAGAEAAGTALRLETCGPTTSQAFMGIMTIYNTFLPAYFIATPDGQLCVTLKGGPASGHPAVLGPCVGTAADTWAAGTWTTGMDLTASASYSYQELYDNNGPAQAYSIGLTGTGAGAKAVLARNQQKASQVWTDLPPSGAGLPSSVGNADGTISLRPLSDTSLCLTVPGANYAAGQQLDVEPCAGQPDQEFLRLIDVAGNGSIQELIPYGDGQLCVTAASTTPDTPITLAACGNVTTQSWFPMQGWYQWGGGNVAWVHPYAPTGITQVLTMGPSTGTAAAAQTAPIVAGDTAQSWLDGQGFWFGEKAAFHPVADAGWCLTTPSPVAGAAVTVQPCDGSASQSIKTTLLAGETDQYVELTSAAAPTLCLTAGSGAAAVTLQPCSPTDTSQWWSNS